MIILSYLGRDASVRGSRATRLAFQYERTSTHVIIDKGFRSQNLIKIPNDQWNKILETIEKTRNNIFVKSGSEDHQTIDKVLESIPVLATNIHQNKQIAACVLAILLHEGSLELYYGTAGPSRDALFVPLRKGNHLRAKKAKKSKRNTNPKIK